MKTYNHSSEYVLPKRKFNPLGIRLYYLLQDKSIRQIILYGGSSSGKSYSVAQMFLVCCALSGENAIVMRKVGASISKSIYEDFKVAASQLGMKGVWRFVDSVKSIRHTSGAKIDFAGLDDPEKIKGISNYRWVFMDEWNEYDEGDHKQIRKRLRGKPGQQIITAFNPVSENHWIKKNVFDAEEWVELPNDTIEGVNVPKELCTVKSIRRNTEKSLLNPRTKEIETHAPDTIIIQSTYLNNFWVVGSPDGTYGYYDEQCVADFEKDRLNDPDYYNIYALGEWGVIRTGSEYFSAFNRGKHTAECPYNPSLPIHVSVDNNVLPYISISLWQAYLDGTIHLRQIDEICAGAPNNSAHLSAVLLAKRLREIDYTDKVYVHGDCTTRNANTIDDLKRSFLDLFISSLEAEGFEVVDMVSKSNPNGAMSGEFINAIWEGILPDLAITIDEKCKTSIEDYMAVQKDVNGGILKTRIKDKVTGQTYEEHGHLCLVGDTLVSTTRGDIPIRDVKIGDEVYTEKGLCEVHNSLCTSWKSHYFLLTLQGRTLRLTYNHPIKTQRGFIPAYRLKDGDTVALFEKGRIWKERLSSIKGTDLIATQIANAKATASIIAGGLEETGCSSKNISTDSCGLRHLAIFLKAIVFTILTVITIIIHLATLPVCLLPSMKNIIRSITVKRHGKKSKADSNAPKKKRLNGIVLKMAESGIPKTQRSSGKAESLVHSCVNSVARPLRQLVSKLRDFVLTTVKPSGAETMDSTMKSAFVQFAALNLWSIGMLVKSAVQGRVPLSIGNVTSVYDISTDNHTFFANGVLVHNSDTLRYVTCDIMSDRFLAYSNKRKRNTFANGAIHFFNPDTNVEYKHQLLYALPNVGGRFVMVHGGKAGDSWHILDVAFMDTDSVEDIKGRLLAINCPTNVFECPPAYFPLVRELRSNTTLSIKVMKEYADIDRRIAATSDYVKGNVLFRDTDDAEYNDFINNLLDYNKDGHNKEASAVLSGFIMYAEKSFSG